MRRVNQPVLALCLLALASQIASAYWSGDPAENFAVADRAGGQTIPKISAVPDGGCYIAWFDPQSGYDVYLQRLEGPGWEAFPHNGMLVSSHSQNSWLVDWDLTTDSNWNAVLTFVDTRTGGDWDVQAYQVSSSGAMLWGPDGVTLSYNADFEVDPKVVEASDGDLVFVWSRMPDVGDGHLMMQRLAPDGTPRFAAGGITIATGFDESPGFADLVAGEDGSVIVAWVRDTSLYGDSYLRAERFDSDGVSLWGGPVEVYSTLPLPIAYHPIIVTDHAGGAVLCWHRAQGPMYNSFVQRLDGDGNPLFPMGGVQVSDLAGYHHISPALAHDETTGETYVFWDERNSNQSQWGIFGQRFDAAGARLWGSYGMEFLPTDTLYKWAIRALPTAGGAECFWIDQPGGYGNDRVRGFHVDQAGEHRWAGGIIDVASTLSGKSRLPVAQTHADRALLVWEDDRGGNADLYAQNVNIGGDLGAGDTGVEAIGAAGRILHGNHPNPFNPSTTLSFTLETAAQVELTVHDAAGRRVVRLLSELMDAGSHELSWQGVDSRGRPLASGVYLARLSTLGRVETQSMVLLK